MTFLLGGGDDEEIEMEPVASSNIAAVGWKGETMQVEFLDGRTWRYEGVPKAVYDSVRRAASVGKEFNRLVRNNYPGDEQ